MKSLHVFCTVGSLSLVLLTGCSNESKPQPAPTLTAAPADTEKPKYFEEQQQKLTATVTALNQETREITLKGQNGNELSFVVSPTVKNLAQVNVGDQVNVGYYESLGINVQKPGEAVNEAQLAGATATPGEMPSAVGARKVTITATVDSFDRTVPSVTLKGPQGNLRTIKIKDAKKLDNVSIGDQVVITYTEALAVSVDKAK